MINAEKLVNDIWMAKNRIRKIRKNIDAIVVNPEVVDVIMAWPKWYTVLGNYPNISKLTLFGYRVLRSVDVDSFEILIKVEGE